MDGVRPWLVDSCLEFLESLTGPDVFAFEWGCGGSTVWFAERCSKVVSVEHDEAWAWKVALQAPKAEIRLVPPMGDDKGDAADPTGYWSSCQVGNFQAYVEAIDLEEPDLILVDGRARASCITMASNVLRPGGWLILDNAERDWYTRRAGDYLDGWERRDFHGEGWITSFWQKAVRL